MHSMTAAQAEQQLTDLAEQFAQWRQDRTSRFAPIPRPLWGQAIALTAVIPLASVAKRLRLRGRDLQKRCAARHQAPEGTPAQDISGSTLPALGFVEVPATVWPLSFPNIHLTWRESWFGYPVSLHPVSIGKP